MDPVIPHAFLPLPHSTYCPLHAPDHVPSAFTLSNVLSPLPTALKLPGPNSKAADLLWQISPSLFIPARKVKWETPSSLPSYPYIQSQTQG